MDLLKPHVRDLGAFSVERVLPAALHRSVGPFVFFDHFGPVRLEAGKGMDVRPHPHIGLATVTYLFEGSGLHRDSLGSAQEIRPFDVNWMVAGHGIVHSERTPEAGLAQARTLHGVQIWVALPQELEQCAPLFTHHAKETLPLVSTEGASVRVILGRAFGVQSPVAVLSPMFYAHATLAPGAHLALAPDYAERGIYPVSGSIEVDGMAIPVGEMAVLTRPDEVIITSTAGASILLIGGDPLPGERYLNWNFVSSSKARIEEARERWKSYPNTQFPEVPGDPEWIPLPT